MCSSDLGPPGRSGPAPAAWRASAAAAAPLGGGIRPAGTASPRRQLTRRQAWRLAGRNRRVPADSALATFSLARTTALISGLTSAITGHLREARFP